MQQLEKHKSHYAKADIKRERLDERSVALAMHKEQ